MTEGQIIAAMRALNRHGVTHFVVNDTLLVRLHAKASEVLDPRDHQPLREDDPGVMHFRGKRLLTQADLKHLPFDPSPPPAGVTRTQADADATETGVSDVV